MKLEKEIEDKIISLVRETFGEGYFLNHTMAAVYWMRELIKYEGGNEKILVPAIYLHDIGYPEVLSKKKNDFESHKNAKELHMEIGAKKARAFLKDFNFKNKEIKEISHLIFVHDKYDLISTKNEQLVFEADCLSALDRKRVKPDFSREDYEKFLKFFEENQAPLFKTITGKKALDRLLPIAKSYFKE